MRLIDQNSIEWKSRNQFFVVAAKAMRNILVDHARTKGRLKRGGDWQEVTLHSVEQSMKLDTNDDVDMEQIDNALEQLATFDERKARLVELRFFAGLSEQDAADVLGIARSTCSEHWRMARAWLHRALKEGAT